MKWFIYTSLLVLSTSWLAGAERTVDLPKVLIIGDSISLGYTPHVVAMLKEEMLVKHHKGNAQHTGTGLKKLDAWLGDTDWDVIHFNWGLWDLCYRHPESKVQGNRDKVKGTITTPLVQYEKNLDELVRRLKQTDAVLIWAHTTVVPEKEAGRIRGDDILYNQAAARIMKQHGVTINDLHTVSSDFGPDLFSGPGNVHFTPAGSKLLAEQVVRQLRAALQSR